MSIQPTIKKIKRAFDSADSSVEVSESRGVRSLHLGGDAIQSAMRLSAPDQLELAYTRAMMSFLLFNPAPRELLMIGLGGGSIARFVHERMLGSRLDVVEINAQVVAAARSFFGVPADDGRLKVVLADGGAYVRKLSKPVEILLLDAFDDGRSVSALATRSFYNACYAALKPGGLLVVNFIEDEPRFNTYLQRIEQCFDQRVLTLPSEDRVNNIVLAFKQRPSRVTIDALKKNARLLKRRYGLPFDQFVRDLLNYNDRSAAFLRVKRNTD